MTYISSFFLLLCLHQSIENIQTGVDLVTRLSNELASGVLQELGEYHENLVLGPLGLASNLGMLLEAAQGKTRQELVRLMNVTGSDMEDLRRGFKAYCDLFLEHSSHTEASGSFNRASLASSLQLQPAYRGLLTKHYCANITEAADSDAGLELGSDSGVMSHWKDFEKLAVYTFLSHQAFLPFTRKDGSTVHVPMIPQVGVFRATRWEKTQAVLLPLETKLVKLLLIMPDDTNNTSQVLQKLTPNTLIQLVQTMPKEEIEIFLPQLTVISKDLNLKSVLQRRGVQLVFDSKKADLTRAADKSRTRAFVKAVVQDAYFSTSFVSLNSVAGLSTSLGVKTRSKRDATKIYFDKPFLFFILHKDTQLVLLAGKVDNPVQVPA